MTTEIERRYAHEGLALRAEGDQPKIGGYALKYNKLSHNLGGFVEQIAAGALRKTLGDGGDVLARYQHEDRFLLGRTAAGTVRLKDDAIGLDYEVDTPDVTYARDLVELVRRGDVWGSSFAFRTLKDHWDWTEGDYPVRTLIEIQLIDVAPVVRPAYPDTSSAVRSLAEQLDVDESKALAALTAGNVRSLLERTDAERPDAPTDTRSHQPGDTHWQGAHAARAAELRLKSRTP